MVREKWIEVTGVYARPAGDAEQLTTLAASKVTLLAAR